MGLRKRGRTAVKSDDECSRSKNSAPMQPCETDLRTTLRVQSRVQQGTSTARVYNQGTFLAGARSLSQNRLRGSPQRSEQICL